MKYECGCDTENRVYCKEAEKLRKASDEAVTKALKEDGGCLFDDISETRAFRDHYRNQEL